jgi:serine/threonine-protein kinase
MIDEIEQLANALSPRFHIEHRLERGLVAQVYLAHDRLRGGRVVVKVLRRELVDSMDEDRFRGEINVSAQLQHPNIVPVYDSGEIDGRPYYVMPFIEGESLRSRISRVKQFSVPEALRIIEDIARALDFAHRRQVVHRDIKPENVMLRGERAILLDFGIALDTTIPRRTSPGMTLGTVEYMSPEQAAGESQIDGRSDIYSLACVAYEMLCGNPPFMGSAIAVLNRHITTEPRALATMCPDVPQTISCVLARALSKLPSERFATASELLAALRRAARNARPRAPRIAVLSFVHVGGRATVDAFSDRITEDVIYALTDVGGIEVSAGSTSSFGETELHISRVARHLDADALVFATVRERTGAVQLAVTVLRANGSHLWSRTYTARERELAYVVSELAAQLAQAVRPALTHPGSNGPMMSAAS